MRQNRRRLLVIVVYKQVWALVLVSECIYIYVQFGLCTRNQLYTHKIRIIFESGFIRNTRKYSYTTKFCDSQMAAPSFWSVWFAHSFNKGKSKTQLLSSGNIWFPFLWWWFETKDTKVCAWACAKMFDVLSDKWKRLQQDLNAMKMNTQICVRVDYLMYKRNIFRIEQRAFISFRLQSTSECCFSIRSVFLLFIDSFIHFAWLHWMPLAIFRVEFYDRYWKCWYLIMKPTVLIMILLLTKIKYSQLKLKLK